MPKRQIQKKVPYVHCIMNDSIKKILDSREVKTLFQPVVSVERRSVIGFEAFARGGKAENESVVMPEILFDTSLDPDVALEIDRICRENTLKRFKTIATSHPEVLLFLNLNLAALKSSNIKPGFLAKQVADVEIDPKRVVVEVAVDRLDNGTLELVSTYQKQGFRLSLDDDNACPDTLGHLHRLKPDFLKIMRPPSADAGQDLFRIELLRALAENSRLVGCRLVGKGVESEDDAFSLLDAGIFLHQGYFYTRSEQKDGSHDALVVFKQKIAEVHTRYQKNQTAQIQAKKTAFTTLHRAVDKARYRCEGTTLEEFPKLAAKLFRDLESAASVFVLNPAGQEVTRTGETGLNSSRDHSIRDYYLHIKTGFEQFVTAPFTSPETKTPHILMVSRFYNPQGDEYILGIEFPAPQT